MLCYTVNSLGVPCFLHASMMCVQWSTLVNYAFPLIICTCQVYSLPAPGLDPGENKACVSATAQFVPWAKMATVPEFSNWTDVKHHKSRSSWACSHTHGRREGQSETHHDEMSLRLHLGGVLSHATVHYIVLHCTCVLTVPWYTLKLQPSLHCLCHVDAVTVDFDNSPGIAYSLSRHTSCTICFWKV